MSTSRATCSYLTTALKLWKNRKEFSGVQVCHDLYVEAADKAKFLENLGQGKERFDDQKECL